jgi:hypothetical protein
MGKGRATGIDRNYQERCRDVLVFRDRSLVPWADDGIDVPFAAYGTTWRLDVALRRVDGGLVVAECRRRRGAVKQGDIAEFSRVVAGLREVLNRPVDAAFFTKSIHQLGALRVGDYDGVTLFVLDENAAPPGFALAEQHLHPTHGTRCQAATVCVVGAHSTSWGGTPSVIASAEKTSAG